MHASLPNRTATRSRFLFSLLCGTLAVLAACGTSARADEIAWSKVFTKAVKQAKTSKKLVMVDFYTDWCGWCKVLDKKTYTDKNVVRLARTNFIPVKINAEKEGREAASKYGVRSYPTILFIDGNGAVAGRIGGYMPAGPFAQEMQKISQSAKDLPAARAAFKKNPDDAAAAAKLTEIYASRGDSASALSAYAAVKKNDPKNGKGYLVKAANTIGDLFQSQRDMDKAVPYFQQAAQVAKVSGDAAYAHMSIAACYAAMRDMGKAVGALKAGLADVKVSASDKKEMQAMLDQLNRMASPAVAAH